MFGFLALIGLVVGLFPVAMIFMAITTARARSRLTELERTVEELTARVRWLEAAEARQRSPVAKTDSSVAQASRPAAAELKPRITPPVEVPSSDVVSALSATEVGQAFRPADGELTPPVSKPEPRAAAPVLATPTEGVDSLETRIGSRWLLYIGVVAIIVGASYFEKLAIENRWIGETARVVQGGIVRSEEHTSELQSLRQ